VNLSRHGAGLYCVGCAYTVKAERDAAAAKKEALS
jgi:hypothetical protein